MRKEHKPLYIIRFTQWLNALYVNRVVRPQFDALGHLPFFLHPRSINVSGRNIHAGNHLHVIGDKNKPVNLSTWSSKQHQGSITIGDHCLISPGVNIASAVDITIGDNCMIAAEVNISDCDWHGVYNRTRPFRCTEKVELKNNVWIGLRSIIGKGICIGENSVVAAGSVVAEDVPDNTIVGGNPAKVIKRIESNRRMLTREFLFKSSFKNSQMDEAHYLKNQRLLDEYLFGNNTTLSWIKSKISPTKED